MTPAAQHDGVEAGDGLASLVALARPLPFLAAVLTAAGATVAWFGATLQRTALGRSMLACLHLDQEASIGTWFSTSVLLLCALAMGHVGRLLRAARHGDARAWSILAAGFALLSLDETVGLHERIGNATARTLQTGALGTFTWILPGAAIVAIGSLVFGRFLRRQERRLRRRLIVACACYFGGALGCETLGAWIFTSVGKESALFEVSVVCEEGLEMFGAVLLLGAALFAAQQVRAARSSDSLSPVTIATAGPPRHEGGCSVRLTQTRSDACDAMR